MMINPCAIILNPVLQPNMSALGSWQSLVNEDTAQMELQLWL